MANINEEVESFLGENFNLDERAIEALRDCTPEIQAAVLAKGPLNDATNPSAALMGRMRAASNPRSAGFGAAWNQGNFPFAAQQQGGWANPQNAINWQDVKMPPEFNEVEEFISENSLDERAASQIRAESAGVQRAVMERGGLSECRNPSSALAGRIREAKSSGIADQLDQLTTVLSTMTVSDEELEAFIRDGGLDERAEMQFRQEPPHIQRLVIDRGSVSECSNPSSAVTGRIRDAKQMGFPEVMMQASSQVSESELDAFLNENELDDKAKGALKREAPIVQRAVIDRGSLSECTNPSSAVIGRIRDAKQSNGMHGFGGFAGAGMGAMYQAWSMPQNMPMMAMGNRSRAPMFTKLIENFIAENCIDEKAAQDFRDCPPLVQRTVIDRGSLVECKNPSSALIGRIRDAKLAVGGGQMHPMGQMQMQMQMQPRINSGVPNQIILSKIEQFLERNGIDEKAANLLRKEAFQVQVAVMERGNLSECVNPSSAVIGRIRDAKQGGGGKAMPFVHTIHAKGFGPQRGKAGKGKGFVGFAGGDLDEVDTFLAESGVDAAAAADFKKEPPAVQKKVMDRGDLCGCANPSSALIGRIRDAKSGTRSKPY